MELPRMNLLYNSTDAGTVVPHDDEEVLRDEPHLLVVRHDLYVGKPLSIRADFILALDDQDSTVAQDP